MLRRFGQGGPYNVPSAVVPERIFQPGAKGGASVAEYRRAVGDDEAMDVLRDYAASNLLRRAGRDDGTLDPRKVDIWRKQHADALRAFPELDRQAADAATASTMLAEAAAARKAALDEYQVGLIGKLIDATDTDDAIARIGAIFGQGNTVALMRRLIAETRSDPAAREGVRKAVVEHMMRRFVGNTESGTSGLGTMKADAFQTFVSRNGQALRLLFKPAEMDAIAAIAADLQRANRSIAAVKLPGGSNTVQDAIAADKAGESILSKLITGGLKAAGGAIGFTATGGPLGALTAYLGTHAVLAMRQAGIEAVDDLVKQAMLDPVVARALLSRASADPSRGPGRVLAARLRSIATAMPSIVPRASAEQSQGDSQ